MKLRSARLALFMILPTLSLSAQQAAEKPEVLTGCVMPFQQHPGYFTFCEKDICSVLTGSLLNAKLASHTVTLHGVVAFPTKTTPRTISITSINKVGESCSQTGNPQPFSSRGLGKHEHPGSEGSTPGERPNSGSDPK